MAAFMTGRGYGGDSAGIGMARMHESGLQNARLQNQLAQAELAAGASVFPHELRQQRFETIFPWLQGQWGQFNSTATGGVGGSQVGQQPEIATGPIWNPQVIQQQVNARRGSIAQQSQGNLRRAKQRLSGQGFGANSPLLAELEAMYGGQSMAQQAAANRDIRQTAAQQNANQIFQTQQAREGQFASRQREDIERRRTLAQNQNALLAALAGLI